MLNLFGKNTPIPNGSVESNGRAVQADIGLVALALQGFSIKGQIENLEGQLKAINDRLENSLGPGSVLVIEGVCRIPIASRQTFKLTDPETCKALLGGRFDDLVYSSVEYTLTDKCKAIVLDPDHPLSESLRACVAIKESRSVTFRPIRPE